MHPSFIRRIHATEVFHRIRLHPNISQQQIIQQTGFDKSTVSSIVNKFDELGLIVRSQSAKSKRPGRPTAAINVSPASGLLIGVQIEQGAIHFAASGLDGVPVAAIRRAFPGQVDDLVDHVETGIAEVRALAGRNGVSIRAVGVSLPGLVSNAGMLIHAPVLRWRNIDIFELLSAHIKEPLYIGNDSKAAALAEHMFGSCIDVDDFIYLFSGSGVGGGLFLKGQTYRGFGGFAGELGHVKVVPNGRLCSCGASGCLSAYLSESALRAELTERGVSVASFAEIRQCADEGNRTVLTVLDTAGEILGAAVADFINIFNPSMVALGGDLSLAARHLRPGLDRALARLAHPAIAEQCSVVFSENSASRPYLGAIALALEGFTGLDSQHVIP
jgi:predicted NBD/HSP70 family sugar kinase